MPGVTVARIGGHFDGAAVLHWPAGSEGRGALLTGDTITVVQDRDWVSFMWSYPNLIPLDEATVDDIAAPGRAVHLRPDLRRLVGRSVVGDGTAAAGRPALGRPLRRTAAHIEQDGGVGQSLIASRPRCTISGSAG